MALKKVKHDPNENRLKALLGAQSLRSTAQWLTVQTGGLCRHQCKCQLCCLLVLISWLDSQKPPFPPLQGGTYFMGWLSVGDALSLEPDREGELSKYLFLIKDEKCHSLRTMLTYQQKIGKTLHISQAKIENQSCQLARARPPGSSAT